MENTVFTLKKQIEYNGKKYTELEFDFDALTGADSIAVSNELKASGKMVAVAAFDEDFLIRIAAKACTSPVGYDLFLTLPISDYMRIKDATRSFLLKSE